MASNIGSTTAIKISELSGTHGVSNKNSQLDLSSKVSKSLSQMRRLIEKASRMEDIERMISDSISLVSRNSGTNNGTLEISQTPERTIEGLSAQETELLAASIYIFQSAVTRSRVGGLSADSFVSELQRLKFPVNAGKILAECVFRNVNLIDESPLMCPTNKLRKIQWRLDVIITSQAGKRILEPVFLLQLQTSSKMVVFEVPLNQFHKMRYATAAVLQEMQTLAGRKIMAP